MPKFGTSLCLIWLFLLCASYASAQWPTTGTLYRPLVIDELSGGRAYAQDIRLTSCSLQTSGGISTSHEFIAWDYVTYTITSDDVTATTCSIAWAGATTTNTVAMSWVYHQVSDNRIKNYGTAGVGNEFEWEYDGTAFEFLDVSDVWSSGDRLRLFITYLK